MRGESVNQGGLLRLYLFNVYALTIYFAFDLKIKLYIVLTMKTRLNTFNKLTTVCTSGLLVIGFIISIIITQSPG